MKLSLKIIISLMAVFPLLAQACWPIDERKEINGFSELDDELILSFKDAIDCKPVTNAKVVIGEAEFITDARGYASLPMGPFAEQMDARMPVEVQRQGYVTLKTRLRVEAGTVLNKKMTMSRVLPPGKLRFVLQWDEEPKDLDLHLTGPGFHISYRHMKNMANRAKLDRDELDGYGPETITLHRLDKNASYSLLVDNYSNEENFTGLENIMVYSGDRLMHNIQLKQGSHRAVRVLDINQSSFEIINKGSARP
jgi:hypothetical protein